MQTIVMNSTCYAKTMYFVSAISIQKLHIDHQHDWLYIFITQNFYQNSKQYHTCALVVVIERPFVRMATPNPDITPLAVFLITRDVSGYILAKTPTKQQLYSLAASHKVLFLRLFNKRFHKNSKSYETSVHSYVKYTVYWNNKDMQKYCVFIPF